MKAQEREAEVSTMFATDVKDHTMTILEDNGLRRHLRCQYALSSVAWFDVVTWKGTLVINGDFGCYVFSRIDDMFAFFRRGDGGINSGYWHQKLIAVCATDGSEEFCHESAMASFESAIEGWSDDAKHEARCQLNDELWNGSIEESSEHDFLRSASYVKVADGPVDRTIDLHELSTPTRFTFRFLWCLHAIVWAIAEYDKAKA